VIEALRRLDPHARAVVAIALALLADWGIARTGLIAFAPVPLAEWIMARTPPDLANELMARLGDLARPSALLGGVAVYLGLTAAIGLVAMPAPRARAGAAGRWLPAVGAGAALWALMVAATGQPVDANLLLGILFLAMLAVLPGRATAPHPVRGRREFLTSLAVSSAAVLVTANVVFIDAILRAAAGATRGGGWLFGWEAPAPRAAGFDLAGLSAEMTPVERFYRMSKNVINPDPDARRWRLRVGGRRWTLDELLGMPRVDVQCTLRCISNRVDGDLMSTATFSGVRLRDLLAASGVAPDGEAVVFVGLDGHSDSIDPVAALDAETIVAYAMNGRALTRAHGHPARLLVPGRYGFKNVKWLSEIRVSPDRYTGHWQDLGWTLVAEVKTMARIDVARRDGPRTVIAGVAFAGTRGISAVRVRLDGGPWLDARLHQPPLGRSTWVQWRLDTEATATTTEAQAVDGAGVPQPVEERGQFPDGAQGLHHVSISGT
jgi:DMSO/TMAO reductase YedYZ molybdopterin-dependent catalytic subunit